MPIYEFEGVRPVVDPAAYVHPQAILIGDVIVNARCFIAPTAVLRGDLGRVIVGKGSNVQDGCVLHTFAGEDVVIEENTHIGHRAVLHGCTVKRGAMVGMGAVVMDRAVIGEEAFVGAMAFVKSGMQVPRRALVMGIPARVVRELGDEEIKWKDLGTAHYRHLAERYPTAANEVAPLCEVEADRKRVPDLGHKPKGG